MPYKAAWAAYLLAAVFGEVLLAPLPAATAVIDASVLVAALTQFGWAQRSPLAIGDPATRLLPAVALVPLLRLLSLTMPVPAFPPAAWVALAGSPLLLAVAATSRITLMNVRDIGLATAPRTVFTLAVVALSIPAGLLVGQLSESVIAVPRDSPAMSGVLAFVVVSCAALPEELIFRGILQPLTTRHIGRPGIIIVALVYAATYVGTGSVPAVALMGLAGLAYGIDMARTGSLWGPILGHSVLAASAMFLAPLLGSP